MILSLFFNIFFMGTPEKQDQNPEKEKFEQAFSEELKNWWDNIDKKSFWDIISGATFDEWLSKEENFKNAFDSKVDAMIQANLKNIPNDKKEELKNLQKQANSWKNIPELLESFNEIKELFATRHAESKKSESDIQNKNMQEKIEHAEIKSQEFLDELKTSISENAKKEELKREELKKQLAENWEHIKQEKASAEWVLDWFPDSQA